MSDFLLNSFCIKSDSPKKWALKVFNGDFNFCIMQKFFAQFSFLLFSKEPKHSSFSLQSFAQFINFSGKKLDFQRNFAIIFLYMEK